MANWSLCSGGSLKLSDMRQISNSDFDALLRHIPIIISRVDLAKCDNKTYNSVRITRKIIKRLLNRIEYETRKQHDIQGSERCL